jgi:hypothetical protein
VRPQAQALARAIAAKESHKKSLMAEPAVLGVGIGAGDTPGKPEIVVFVEQGKPVPAIPARMDGIKTNVKSVKRFHAFASCAQ